MVFFCTPLLVLGSLAVAVASTQSLYVKVSGPAEVDSVDHLQVVVTVTNIGDETLKVLNDPRGPLSTRPTDTFSITSTTGATSVFTGIKVKYLPKTAVVVGAFTVLAHGESVQVEHAVAHAYSFTHSGIYDVRAYNAFLVVHENNTVSTIYANSEAHSVQVAGSSSKFSAAQRTPIVKRESYVGCSSPQQTSIVSAASAAEKYASSALSYASSHPSSTVRYTTWFGNFTAARYSTVLSHFKNISSNAISSFTFDCTCTDDDLYAYVYPDNFGYINLCGAFWGAPNTGTDSKGGTLIHESSHFTKNGGTDDYAYGQTDAKALAISSPSEAIENADSHEYYAENNPALV